MTLVQQSLLAGMIQVLLVGALGAKFMIDRATYPRVWVETQPFDPDLPIRGRYVRIRAVVAHDPPPAATDPVRASAVAQVRLEARDGKLIGVPDASASHWINASRCAEKPCWVLSQPLAYFIPEHVADPSVRADGETLWVEVTVPPNGPPRPIRLGVKANGIIRSLDLR